MLKYLKVLTEALTRMLLILFFLFISNNSTKTIVFNYRTFFFFFTIWYRYCLKASATTAQHVYKSIDFCCLMEKHRAIKFSFVIRSFLYVQMSSFTPLFKTIRENYWKTFQNKLKGIIFKVIGKRLIVCNINHGNSYHNHSCLCVMFT